MGKNIEILKICWFIYMAFKQPSIKVYMLRIALKLGNNDKKAICNI